MASEVDIRQRLGEPNYRGTWAGNHTVGTFDMYVLRRNLGNIIERNDPHSPETHFREAVDNVEGVIFDDLGMSIFSGEIGERSVRFTKTYAQNARHSGVFHELDYTGTRADGKTVFRGNYTPQGLPSIKGEFTLFELHPLDK